MQVKGTMVASIINEGLSNIVRNFSKVVPLNYIQGPKRLPIIGEINDREQFKGWVAKGIHEYKKILINKLEGKMFDDVEKEVYSTYLVIPNEIIELLLDYY